LKGDANTTYFHAIANGRCRKCAILALRSDEGVISGKHAIQAHIYQFYENLMGSEEPKFLNLAENYWDIRSTVSQEENEALALTFTMEELHDVLQNTKTATVPGPDGFPMAFYKKFWPSIKQFILQILNDFTLGTIDISRLNFGILSLIPKFIGAISIKQYRPIALINILFKFVSKVVANRLAPIAHKIIAPTQTAFIKGRLLLDGAISLQEIIHELKINKSKAILLKLDFEKAYNRVS
jgi:hypothetical protein